MDEMAIIASKDVPYNYATSHNVPYSICRLYIIKLVPHTAQMFGPKIRLIKGS